jgi:hypothetical protein
MGKVDEAERSPEGQYLVHRNEIGSAVWWPDCTSGSTRSSDRYLQGEIKIPPGIVPSTSFGIIDISVSIVALYIVHSSRNLFQYIVSMHRLSTTGFETVSEIPLSKNLVDPQNYIASIPVQIAHLLPSGPRPKSFTPPGYGGDVSHVTRTDYNVYGFV